MTTPIAFHTVRQTLTRAVADAPLEFDQPGAGLLDRLMAWILNCFYGDRQRQLDDNGEALVKGLLRLPLDADGNLLGEHRIVLDNRTLHLKQEDGGVRVSDHDDRSTTLLLPGTSMADLADHMLFAWLELNDLTLAECDDSFRFDNVNFAGKELDFDDTLRVLRQNGDLSRAVPRFIAHARDSNAINAALPRGPFRIGLSMAAALNTSRVNLQVILPSLLDTERALGNASIDLDEFDLTGLDLRGMDLRGVQLDGATFDRGIREATLDETTRASANSRLIVGRLLGNAQRRRATGMATPHALHPTLKDRAGKIVAYQKLDYRGTGYRWRALPPAVPKGASKAGSYNRITHRDQDVVRTASQPVPHINYSFNKKILQVIRDNNLSRIVPALPINNVLSVAPNLGEADLFAQVHAKSSPYQFDPAHFALLAGDLDTLHRHGGVHRDIKLNNIFVVNGVAVLTDTDTMAFARTLSPFRYFGRPDHIHVRLRSPGRPINHVDVDQYTFFGAMIMAQSRCRGHDTDGTYTTAQITRLVDALPCHAVLKEDLRRFMTDPVAHPLTLPTQFYVTATDPHKTYAAGTFSAAQTEQVNGQYLLDVVQHRLSTPVR